MWPHGDAKGDVEMGRCGCGDGNVDAMVMFGRRGGGDG